jgi:hypothetical protein
MTGARIREVSSMKTIRTLAIIVLILLAAFRVWDASRPAVYRRLSTGIRVGDDKLRVCSIMGSPTRRTGTGGSGLGAWLLRFPPEIWFYGSNPIRSGLPWLTPVQLRFSLFEPVPGEVAVFFDSSGKVTRVESR